MNQRSVTSRFSSHARASALVMVLGLALTSCKQGPDYKRPPVEVPTTYKSAQTQESDSPRLGQDWWLLFNDDKLTALEEAAMTANFDIKAAMARVAQARAASKAVKSGFYPVITLDPSIIRGRTSGNGVGGRQGARTVTDTTVPLDLTYEIDIWGRVQRSYEASEAQVDFSVDDLAVIRQTLAADVAQDYFTIRSLDAQAEILARNVALYRNQIELIQRQFKAGLVSKIDIVQVQTLLDSTRAQEIDIQRQRADLEHALAILLGRPPSELAVESHPLDGKPPTIPAGLPAELLRRRPDVAGAEENLVAANAQIGVADANFFPTVRLTGAAGFESINIQRTFDWESRIWSLGPSVTFPIFEGGKLRANLEQARARYDELNADYRTAVLGAFRDVEDSLTDIHARADQAGAQDKAVASAREVLRLAETQYRQGLVNNLQVIDADRTVLTNELSAAQILNQRMVSTILLIKALGGGWDAQHPAATRPAETRPKD